MPGKGRCVWLIAIVVLTSPLILLSSHNAEAVIEPIYTLPFSDSSIITCPFGPYSECPPPLIPGFHYGTDYQLGNVSAPGEAIVAAAGHHRH